MHYPNHYDYYFQLYAGQLFGSSLDWRWFKAQAMAESNLNPTAKSYAGAFGVMQLMPDTAAEMAAKLDIDNNVQAPHININMGIGYAHRCFNIWQKESGIERIRFMLGSYNAGPGNIIKAQKRAAMLELPTDEWDSIIVTLPGITGRYARETINYVARIETFYCKLIKETRA